MTAQMAAGPDQNLDAITDFHDDPNLPRVIYAPVADDVVAGP